MLKLYLVILLMAFIACPIHADLNTLNEDLGKIVKDDEDKQIVLGKQDEIDLSLFLQTFDDEGEKGFDCDVLCQGFEDKILTLCLETCEYAEKKVRENRQQPKCDKPENMELIPAGSFLMGSTDDGRLFEDFGYMKTKVIIANDFYIDKYEVTQSKFESVMGYNPAYYQGKKCGEQCPVESITWDEANSFCSAAGKRLPTSAEWEYAAKGGTTTRHYWGNEINSDYLWYKNNSGKKPKPVGKKLPNAYGLFDMEGNVFEYVQDCDSYYSYNDFSDNLADIMMGISGVSYKGVFFSLELLVDPLYAKDDCEKRLIKGSSFAFEGKAASPHYSYDQDVNERRGDRGFRCVMDAYSPHCQHDNE